MAAAACCRVGVVSSSADAKPSEHSLHGSSRISSVSNPFVKHCVKLRLSSSYRRSCRTAILIGATPLLEICRLQEARGEMSSLVQCVVLMDGIRTPEEVLRSADHLVHVSAMVMKKISGLESVDSVKAAALMRFPPTFCDLDSSETLKWMGWFNRSPHRVLILDGIQDPGNIGTLLRSAMAFKWDGVFLLPGCCDPFNEKALRAARGASFHIPIVSGEWSHIDDLVTVFNMKMLAAHPDNHYQESRMVDVLSQSLAESFEFTPLCLVLGSEGQGLSARTLQACKLVSIPMPGMCESLNVAVAGGIFLFMLKPKHR